MDQWIGPHEILIVTLPSWDEIFQTETPFVIHLGDLSIDPHLHDLYV